MSEQSPQKSSSVTAVTLEAFMNSVLMYAIITTDTEGIITDWSPGAELIFGYTKAEVLGSSAELIFTPEDRQKNVPLKELETARNEGHAPDERWHLRKNGERFFMSGTVTALYDKELIGYVKVARDMTDQKSSEEALQLSELRKNHQLSRLGEEMGAFTLISAEQVKKPVMNLYIDAELLIRSEAAKLSDSGKAMLRRMQSSLRKMNLLLDDMQQLARISTGDVLMKTSLKEAVNAALAGLEKKSRRDQCKNYLRRSGRCFRRSVLTRKAFLSSH